MSRGSSDHWRLVIVRQLLSHYSAMANKSVVDYWRLWVAVAPVVCPEMRQERVSYDKVI